MVDEIRKTAYNIRFALCPGDVVLVLFCYLITLVLGRQRSAFYSGTTQTLTVSCNSPY